MSAPPVSVERLLAAGYLRPIDFAFAQAMVAIDAEVRGTPQGAGPGEPCVRTAPDAGTAETGAVGDADVAGQRLLAVAAALASRHISEGHVCLPLEQLARTPPRVVERGPAGALTVHPFSWPGLDTWRTVLTDAVVVSAPNGSSSSPLVLDPSGRLYLRRYFEHEEALVREVLRRVDAPPDTAANSASVARLFSPRAGVPPARPDAGALAGAGPATPQLALGQAQLSLGQTVDLQRRAVEVALQRPFSIITGGPGTGKTATVVKLLALWLERRLRADPRPPRMHLLAPTGKAAARLSESIANRVAEVPCDEAVRAALPREASTIHRALGTLPDGQVGFRHDARNPLVTEFVVVDEASMVDLALMRRLLTAIPAAARVVLLGDRDQLASVEAGAVLGDLCGAGLPPEDRRGNAIAECHVHLTRSYRYRADSGIGRLAEAIRRRRASEVLSILTRTTHRDVTLHPPPREGVLGDALDRLVTAGYRGVVRAPDAPSAFAALEGFRVLCAHRHGPSGVVAVSELIERTLRAQGWMSRDPNALDGRPIIVNQNDYALGRFNGDVGVLLRGAPGEPLRACFRNDDGSGFVRVSPRRLPPHEAVYAMSVHRSQGSEMDSVAVILPPVGSPLLTRELLYTAVTRARKRVALFGAPEAVVAAVETTVSRASGLRRRLWGQ